MACHCCGLVSADVPRVPIFAKREFVEDAVTVYTVLQLCPTCYSSKNRMDVDYYSDFSRIPDAGRGLFAKRDFRLCELIGQYKGRLLSPELAEICSDRTYFMDRPADAHWRLERGIIDGGYDFNDMRLINHSAKSPNCLSRVLKDGRVCIYARRPIKVGEELLMDYGYEI